MRTNTYVLFTHFSFSLSLMLSLTLTPPRAAGRGRRRGGRGGARRGGGRRADPDARGCGRAGRSSGQGDSSMLFTCRRKEVCTGTRLYSTGIRLY